MLKKITTEELISRYAGGERDFRGSNLEDANLEGANLAGANLSRANLSHANLEGATLKDANLEGAYLSRANLASADLRGANLEGAILARANLAFANLSGADLYCANLYCAILAGANLASADLRGAKLADAKLEGAIGLSEIEPFPIDAKIAEAVGDGENLDMDSWHSSCGTAHCRAGWAVTLHPQGAELEDKYGTNAAAALIYNVCSVSVRTPNWCASNAEALADIRRLAALAAKVVATPADVQGTP